MCVCLTLKTDIQVCAVEIAVLTQSCKPFQYVDDIEWQEEKFALLGCVYSFVVDDIAVNPGNIACPYGAEKIQTESFRHQTAFHYQRPGFIHLSSAVLVEINYDIVGGSETDSLGMVYGVQSVAAADTLLQRSVVIALGGCHIENYVAACLVEGYRVG